MPLLSPAALLIDEIARTGSIRRAAERLNVSASAVNRQVLNLEAEMGVPLFERLPRGVRLTAAGELIVAEVRRWRHELAAAKGRIQDIQGLRRGHVRVGIMECFVADLMPRVVSRLQQRYSQIAIDIEVGGTDELVDHLVAGDLDLALCFNPPQNPALQTVFKLRAAPGLFMAKSHPLAARKAVRLTDCAPYTFILPGRQLAIRTVLDKALQRAGIDPPTVVTTNSTTLMKMLVRDGSHLAILGGIDVYRELAEGDFAFVPLADERFPPEELCLIEPRKALPPPAAAVLGEIIREEVEALPVPGRS